MMNIDDLLHTLQNAMNELNGKDIREKCAIELIREIISKIPEINSLFSLENYQLCYKTEHFGKISVINFTLQYAMDKRTYDGLGYHIKAIKVVLARNLPLTLDISMLNQELEHDIALMRKKEKESQIKLLEQQIAWETAIMNNLMPSIS